MSDQQPGYDELTISDVTVKYDAEGNPEDLHVHFAESSGITWFEYEDGFAQYDGHVHSVDREKAEQAVKNLPFVSEVSMEWTGRESAQEESQ